MSVKLWDRRDKEIVEIVGAEFKDERLFLRISDSNGICKYEFKTIEELKKEFSDLEEDFDNGSFTINYEEKSVRTHCGEFYHDYFVSFEKIKELANMI